MTPKDKLIITAIKVAVETGFLMIPILMFTVGGIVVATFAVLLVSVTGLPLEQYSYFITCAVLIYLTVIVVAKVSERKFFG